MQTLSNDDLKQIIIDREINWIRAQRQYRNRPLWLPSPTADQQRLFDEQWTEAIERNLHIEINEQVKEIAATLNGPSLAMCACGCGAFDAYATEFDRRNSRRTQSVVIEERG